VDLAQFETACANELGLDATNEKTTIDDAINVAVQRVLEDTHCYVKKIDYTGFDGTDGDYVLDDTILEIIELYISSGSTQYQLTRVSVPELIERRRVSVASGSPTSFYAETGANLMMFWPAPTADATLTLYHVPVPTALSGGTDDPSVTTPTNFGGIPTILHRAIFYFACSELASYDDDASSAQGQRYRDWYDKEIIRYQKILRKKGGDRNARAIVNEKRRRRAFHTNDIYPSS
jgi:hypothetical protein